MENIQIPIKQRLKNLMALPEFWVFFFFLIRLVGITNAPLESGHNWRQSLTNMISRNFYEHGIDFLYPMIDLAGEKSGIIGSEFPFFNALVALFAFAFEYDHWYGRLINLIVSSLGVLYFAKTLQYFFKPRVVLASTLILLTSIWFAFSRKMMPDTFSVSLVIIGVYHACKYLNRGRVFNLIYFFVFTTLGVLCKIPALSLLAGFGVILFLPEINNKRKMALITAGIGLMALVVTWYFYWVPHLVKTYGYQLYFPKSLSEGLLEIAPLWDKLLHRFSFTALYSWVAFALYLLGLVFLFKNNHNKKLWVFGLISVVFAVFIVKTGAVFPLHNYYVIPFVPVMAIVAGIGVGKLPSKWGMILLCLVGLEGIINQQHDFFISPSAKYKLKLEGISQQYVAPGELVIMNGGPSPQNLYFAHQKGWPVDDYKLHNPTFVDSLTLLGARFMIIDRKVEEEFKYPNTLIFEDQHYQIYALTPKKGF